MESTFSFFLGAYASVNGKTNVVVKLSKELEMTMFNVNYLLSVCYGGDILNLLVSESNSIQFGVPCFVYSSFYPIVLNIYDYMEYFNSNPFSSLYVSLSNVKSIYCSGLMVGY